MLWSNEDFTRVSAAQETPIDGAQLTSMSQGLRLLSRSISKPNNSKHPPLVSASLFVTKESMVNRTMSVISSQMSLNRLAVGSVFVSSHSANVGKSHLLPEPITSLSVLYESLFLLIEVFVK